MTLTFNYVIVFYSSHLMTLLFNDANVFYSRLPGGVVTETHSHTVTATASKSQCTCWSWCPPPCTSRQLHTYTHSACTQPVCLVGPNASEAQSLFLHISHNNYIGLVISSIVDPFSCSWTTVPLKQQWTPEHFWQATDRAWSNNSLQPTSNEHKFCLCSSLHHKTTAARPLGSTDTTAQIFVCYLYNCLLLKPTLFPAM